MLPILHSCIYSTYSEHQLNEVLTIVPSMDPLMNSWQCQHAVCALYAVPGLRKETISHRARARRLSMQACHERSQFLQVGFTSAQWMHHGHLCQRLSLSLNPLTLMCHPH